MDIVTDGSTLVLSGDFDVRSTSQARAAPYDLLARADAVVVDGAGGWAVDTPGLGVLGGAPLGAGRAGHHLARRGCGPALRQLLLLSRLIRVVEVERVATPA